MRKCKSSEEPERSEELLAPSRSLRDSLKHAFRGITFALRTQRNMRIHFLLTLLILLIAIGLDATLIEIAILVLTVSAVWVTELVNTSIEAIVDLESPTVHPLAKVAKDVAAAAVLVSALASLGIAYLLFFDRIRELHPVALRSVVHTPTYVTLLALGGVIVLALGMKVINRRAAPHLQGGMPSLHTAFAFSLATITLFVGASGFAALLGFVLAALVAESRLESGVHTFGQVLVGALLGVGFTMLAFQVLITGSS